MRITRHHLQLRLGSLWLLDGVLQCQPVMFSRYFTREILAPAGQGQPTPFAEPLHLAPKSDVSSAGRRPARRAMTALLVNFDIY